MLFSRKFYFLSTYFKKLLPLMLQNKIAFEVFQKFLPSSVIFHLFFDFSFLQILYL